MCVSDSCAPSIRSILSPIAGIQFEYRGTNHVVKSVVKSVVMLSKALSCCHVEQMMLSNDISEIISILWNTL